VRARDRPLSAAARRRARWNDAAAGRGARHRAAGLVARRGVVGQQGARVHADGGERTRVLAGQRGPQLPGLVTRPGQGRPGRRLRGERGEQQVLGREGLLAVTPGLGLGLGEQALHRPDVADSVADAHRARFLPCSPRLAAWRLWAPGG
jgi:hypothetical protein